MYLHNQKIIYGYEQMIFPQELEDLHLYFDFTVHYFYQSLILTIINNFVPY